MKRVMGIVVGGMMVVLLLSGCASVTPINGTLYTDVKGPLAVGNASGSSKVGTAKCTAIVGIASGDCSIGTAMANGGITKVHHVDCQTKSFFGIYAEYTTTVYGE